MTPTAQQVESPLVIDITDDALAAAPRETTNEFFRHAAIPTPPAFSELRAFELV